MSEEEKTIAIIAKIKPKQWKEMGRTIMELKEFTAAGGVSSFAGSVVEAVKLQIGDYMSPLTNEIVTLINTALQPLLDDFVTIVNDLTAFIGEGAEGALIGGVVGSIASLFLPGGLILTAIGAIIGAAIQKISENTEEENAKMVQNILFDLDKMTKGFFADIGRMWSGFWSDTGLF